MGVCLCLAEKQQGTERRQDLYRVFSEIGDGGRAFQCDLGSVGFCGLILGPGQGLVGF